MTGAPFRFDAPTRVGVCGTGSSIAYARWLLGKLGAEVVSGAPPAPDVPMIVSGTAALPPAGDRPPLVVRLWDFHVGMTGSGIQASAVSGVSWVIGLPGRAPLFLPARIPEKWCATLGVSILLTHFVEQLTLPGVTPPSREVDVSAAEILRGFADQNFGNHKQIPTSWRRNGRVSPEHGGIFPQGFFACADGYVSVIGRSRQDWALILAALGNPAWATDELRDPFKLARDSTPVDAHFAAELRKHTRDELLALALKVGATFAPVYARAEIRPARIVRDSFFDAGGAVGLPFEITA